MQPLETDNGQEGERMARSSPQQRPTWGEVYHASRASDLLRMGLREWIDRWELQVVLGTPDRSSDGPSIHPIRQGGSQVGVRGGKEGKGKEEEERAEEAVRDHLTSQTMHDSRRTERIGPHLFSSPRGEGGTKSWVIGKEWEQLTTYYVLSRLCISH